MNIKKIEIQKVGKNNFLLINDYVWMWDTTQEKLLQKELAKKSYGDVLVAGYGLGIVQKYLLENPKVKSVTTLEKYKDIIEECRKKLGKIYGKITIDDFYNYSGKKYDCIIGDIWPDIAKEFLKDYLKFKKKSETLLKKDGRILAWGGDFFEYLLQKNNVSLSLEKDKINFRCLKEKCPKSCCGPFNGVQSKLFSLYKHGFSDIALSRENVDYIRKIGKKDKAYLDNKTRLWFVRLNKDKSCPFHIKGSCGIYKSQPPMCKAYPLYLDPFAGLCIDTSCPGVGKGWTKIKDLKKEINALKEINDLWIKTISF